MPEDKKPKIDLKARLGKGAATPAPAPVAPAPAPISSPGTGSVPPPVPAAAVSAPTPAPPQLTPSGVPLPPPGFQRPVAIDTSSPFAPPGAYLPQPAAPAPAPPPAALAPARIEVDEMAVQTAAKSARRQGLVIGVIVAVILGAVGYVGGGAAQQGADRTRSHNDAVELKKDVGTAKDALKTLADKVSGGVDKIKAHQFPDTLSAELGAVNVDFDGSKLAGRRFSGFPAATASDLVEFITAVQGVKDRQLLIQSLLNTLKAPITAQFAVPPGQVTISQVLVVSKDPSNNFAGFLAPLTKPLTVTSTNITLPPKLDFTDPGGGNAEAPRYTGGDIAKDHTAVYVVPKTFESACPSAKLGQVSQLGAQMGNFIHDITGDKPDPNNQDVVQDTKPGLLERADRLIAELDKVAN